MQNESGIICIKLYKKHIQTHYKYDLYIPITQYKCKEKNWTGMKKQVRKITFAQRQEEICNHYFTEIHLKLE